MILLQLWAIISAGTFWAMFAVHRQIPFRIAYPACLVIVILGLMASVQQVPQ